MTRGIFHDKETYAIIHATQLENELSDRFLFDEMKYKDYPKVSYITLLGKIACGESSYVDRGILDKILDNNLYKEAVYFLCERYTFRKY